MQLLIPAWDTCFWHKRPHIMLSIITIFFIYGICVFGSESISTTHANVLFPRIWISDSHTIYWCGVLVLRDQQYMFYPSMIGDDYTKTLWSGSSMLSYQHDLILCIDNFELSGVDLDLCMVCLYTFASPGSVSLTAFLSHFILHRNFAWFISRSWDRSIF